MLLAGETRATDRRATKRPEKVSHAARVSASQAILDRAYGKAPTFNTNDSATFKRAVDMTDDEPAAIVAKAKLTVVK